MVLSYAMEKERNNVLTSLGVITRESVQYQYRQWCQMALSYPDYNEDPLDKNLLSIITEEELEIAIEVTNAAFDSSVASLEEAFITSLLTLITETKKGE
tara:strand:+ start:396 stop:692 length:297 start_codon:yes stop_codon:yes gene_type:complete